MTKTKIPKLSTLIKSHKFDWVNPSITDTLFKIPKEIGTDFKLFHFNRYISSEDAIKEMEKEGYRAANIYELLSWKDWNNTDWVVALGSVGRVDGHRYVPYLFRYDSKRELSLGWFVGDWNARYRFLGVRNSEIGTSDTQSGTLDTCDTLTLAIETVKNAGYVVYKVM